MDNTELEAYIRKIDERTSIENTMQNDELQDLWEFVTAKKPSRLAGYRKVLVTFGAVLTVSLLPYLEQLKATADPSQAQLLTTILALGYLVANVIQKFKD